MVEHACKMKGENRLELLFAVVVVLDDLGDIVGIRFEIPLFEFVDCDVEAGAEEDGYADLRLWISPK